MGFLAVIFVYQLVLLWFEVKQAASLGPRHHFGQLWNWIDAIGIISMLLYCLIHFFGKTDWTPPKDGKALKAEERETFSTFLLLWGTLATTSRSIYQLKIFPATRTMIKMIVETIIDLIPFMIVLLAMIFLVSLADLIVYKHLLDNRERALWDSYLEMYQVLFGENPDPEFTESQIFKWIYYMQTIALNVMTLNLVISVVSNTFEKMQNIQKSSDVKQRVEMIMEVEVLMVGQRDGGAWKYLHQIKYSDGEEQGAGGGGGDEWEGKIR